MNRWERIRRKELRNPDDCEEESIGLLPELHNWLDVKYREKYLVGNVDQIDQRENDDERSNEKEY